MEKLLSNRLPSQFLPESYILPPEKRPNIVPKYKTIPVIDLQQVDNDQKLVVQEIISASQEFGFFQVINHGLPDKVIKDMMGVAEEFFQMDIEDKMLMYSEDPNNVSRLFTSIDYEHEENHIWRDVLTHPCYPVEHYKHLWPSKPANYRQIAETYSVAVRSLGLRLFELITEGLGIPLDYFRGELSETQLMAINHYPPCPDPSLTLGLLKHSDPNLITVLFQGSVSGLQVLHDGDWIAVEPIPNAFIINSGHLLQVMSSGRLKSAEHRVVTNSNIARTTVATFIAPSMECIVEPVEELAGEPDTTKLRPFKYAEFLQVYLALRGDTDAVLKAFEIQ